MGAKRLAGRRLTARSATWVHSVRAGSSVAEQGTFNPLVVGSNPTRLARRDDRPVADASRGHVLARLSE